MLDSLYIRNFRCFEDLQVESLGRVNLVVGKNNTGKSTLLESVLLLASAGANQVIHEILNKRGDLLLDKQTPNLFFNGDIPISHSNRLEISDSESKNSLIITLINQNNNENRLPMALPKTGIIPKFTLNPKLSILAFRDGQYDINPIPNQSCTTQLLNENDLAKIWDQVFLNIDDSILKEALGLIEPSIMNIAFIPSPQNNASRMAVVKLQNISKAVPIRSLGDGMIRLLQIFLHATQAVNGFLLLDEFENGLHYSIQQKVWDKLFKVAEELNIQVFATTHSMDTIRSFCRVAKADKDIEGKLITLARSVGTSDQGKIFASVYNENDLEWIINSGMEIR